MITKKPKNVGTATVDKQQKTHVGRRGGRPTKSEARAIDLAILEAAKRRFFSEGFDATTMEAVASDAEITKATLYARYSTKEALVRAVVEDQTSKWEQTYSLFDMPPEIDPRERLRFYAKTIILALRTEEFQGVGRLARSSSVRSSELARAIYDLGYHATVSVIADGIVDGMRDRGRPPRNPLGVAHLLMRALVGWQETDGVIAIGTQEDAIEFAYYTVDILMHGIEDW